MHLPSQKEITFIICIDNSPKAFLPSSIPNLHLHNLLIDSNALKPKIHTNCDHVVLVELVVGESKQEGGFTHRTVIHHHELVLIVILSF